MKRWRRITLGGLVAALGMLVAEPLPMAKDGRASTRQDFRRAQCPTWLVNSKFFAANATPLRCQRVRIPKPALLVISHKPMGETVADEGVALERQVFDPSTHAPLPSVLSQREESQSRQAPLQTAVWTRTSAYNLSVVDMDGDLVDEVLETISAGHGGLYTSSPTLLAFGDTGALRPITIPIRGELQQVERYDGNTDTSRTLCAASVTLEPAAKGNKPHLRVYSEVLLPGENTQECAPPQDKHFWLEGSKLVTTPQRMGPKRKARPRR